ncbi:hypothetical protein C8F01DRAFT_1081654 [Mycena amicta]|nr:hypothetical protein C8F01DRAFT_1081654 [Mycena amicta]
MAATPESVTHASRSGDAERDGDGTLGHIVHQEVPLAQPYPTIRSAAQPVPPVGHPPAFYGRSGTQQPLSSGDSYMYANRFRDPQQTPVYPTYSRNPRNQSRGVILVGRAVAAQSTTPAIAGEGFNSCSGIFAPKNKRIKYNSRSLMISWVSFGSCLLGNITPYFTLSGSIGTSEV